MTRNVAHNTADAKCFPAVRQGSAGPRERPADGAAEAIRKQGANFAHPGPRGKRRPTWTTPQPRKGFQNLGFGGVLSSLSFAAERKGAVGDIKNRGAGEADSPRPRSALAMTGFFHELRRAIRRPRCGHPALRGTSSAVGRDDVGIVLLCIIVGAVGLVFPSLLHFSSFCGILGMFHLILKEFSPWKP